MTKLIIILIPISILYAATISSLEEWGIQIAARNDCKNVRCLVDKFHLFEKGNASRRELDELLAAKKYEQYKKLTIGN